MRTDWARPSQESKKATDSRPGAASETENSKVLSHESCAFVTAGIAEAKPAPGTLDTLCPSELWQCQPPTHAHHSRQACSAPWAQPAGHDRLRKMTSPCGPLWEVLKGPRQEDHSQGPRPLKRRKTTTHHEIPAGDWHAGHNTANATVARMGSEDARWPCQRKGAFLLPAQPLQLPAGQAVDGAWPRLPSRCCPPGQGTRTGRVHLPLFFRDSRAQGLQGRSV